MTINTILKQISIFKSLSDEALEKLAAEFKSRILEAGEVLFNLGDAGSEMFIVLDGKIAIYMPESNAPQAGQALRIFHTGEVLGEMALIDQMPRSASARAEVKSLIASLDRTTFKNLLADSEVALAVMSGLNSRIRYTTDFIAEIRQWVQRLAEGNYQAIQAPIQVQDSSLSALAAEFVRMASQVREREEKLQQEVVQLRIEIDETKRKQQFSQITESEYYLSIKEKLKAMREQQDEDE
jgi:CRP/FNR family transcriptional regulator, cyclic AMP receptor protein